jgi:Caspase domain
MSWQMIMKRKALIIANQDPLLTGISKDITHIESFLGSLAGGAWDAGEITTIIDQPKEVLLSILNLVKRSSYEYIMVFFTGHGGAIRQETYIQINNKKELISQSELQGLSAKQINIYDCCRAEIEGRHVFESSSLVKAAIDRALELTREQARVRYEEKIYQAKPQQLILYSCSLSECSLDTADGALYLSALLKNATNQLSEGKYVENAKLALECHNAVAPIVKARAKGVNQNQNPDYLAQKHLNTHQDHLILSINPYQSN